MIPILPSFRNRRLSRQWGGTDPVDGPPGSMAPAVVLAAVATLFAGLVAYGTHPTWAQWNHGLDVILLCRRLQWPFIAVSLIATIGLLATIIAGRQSAGWLIALAPVLALFVHRFATDPIGRMAAIENPTFVAPGDAGGFIDNDDYVVGITFEGKNYAYPYAALYSTPAVIHAQHDKRLLLMWSAPANRALALTVTRDVKGRDLDIVSMPANALLLYDTSGGVFINGLTGRTTEGQKPHGFLQPVATSKMQWWKWRVTYPESQVMVPAGKLSTTAPRQPMQPLFPMPGGDPKQAADLKITLIGTERPAAVPSRSVTAAPINLTADSTPVLVFREPLTGVARGFRRRIDDLFPRFRANRNPGRKDVVFIDSDTNSGWNAAGVAIEAKKEFRGKRLAPVIVEDELYWGVMKFWYPELQLPGAETGDSQKVLELRSPGPDGAAKSTGTTEPPARSVTRAGNDATVSVKSNRPPKPARTKP